MTPGSPAWRQLRPRERGTALLCVLMVTTVLATLSAAVVLITSIESRAAANYTAAQHALYAADAALESVVSELRGADWSLLPGVLRSRRLRGNMQPPRAPDGRVLDLARLQRERQAMSDGRAVVAGNNPVWHLFGHGPFSDLTSPAAVVPPVYLLVWVGEDDGEEDREPDRDSNGILKVRVDAFGVLGAHRSVDATLSRQVGVAPGSPHPDTGLPPVMRAEVRVLSWKEVR